MKTRRGSIVYASVRPPPVAPGRCPRHRRRRTRARAAPAAPARGRAGGRYPRRAGAVGPDAGVSVRDRRASCARGGSRWLLTPDAGKADRLEAFDEVSLRVDRRRANGERLTYFAEDERYVMTGTAASPVCVVDPDRATTGKTLVFFRSADKVLVDGNEEFRTQTKPRAAGLAHPHQHGEGTPVAPAARTCRCPHSAPTH